MNTNRRTGSNTPNAPQKRLCRTRPVLHRLPLGNPASATAGAPADDVTGAWRRLAPREGHRLPTGRRALAYHRDSPDLGAGWPRSRVEVLRGSGSRLSGPRHGPGPRPAKWASSRHCRHAQEREAAQVPGPRRLLGPRWARGGAGWRAAEGGWAAASGGERLHRERPAGETLPGV